MSIIALVLIFCGTLIVLNLVFPFLTVFASFFKKEIIPARADKEHDFACVITAYGGNARLVVPLVESLLAQTHASHLIYVVEDDCDIQYDAINERVIRLKPAKKLSSKVKSFILAVESFRRHHDAVVIFDPDNVPRKDFLTVLNDYIAAGYKAVQGCRTAKNLDTVYACADATGEIYKNYIERYAPFLLGSSATIAGSGMAIETNLFREYLQWDEIQKRLTGTSIIVEDKMMQNFIAGRGFQIAYAKGAIVYDEKVGSGEQTQRQRSRWLYSHFANLPDALLLIAKGVARFDINQLILGLATSAPPMFILLFSSMLFAALSLFFSKGLFIALLAAIIIFTGNILLTLKLSNASEKIWKSIFGTPLFIYRQFLGLFQMGLSKKGWLVTDNRNTATLREIEQVNA